MYHLYNVYLKHLPVLTRPPFFRLITSERVQLAREFFNETRIFQHWPAQREKISLLSAFN